MNYMSGKKQMRVSIRILDKVDNPNDLLIQTATLKKDIVNELIGKLPNVIPINIQQPNHEVHGRPSKTEPMDEYDPDKGLDMTKWVDGFDDIFAVFDTSHIGQAFMFVQKIYGTLFEWNDEKKEKGQDLGGYIQYTIYYEVDNEYAHSITKMILNYYKKQENAIIWEEVIEPMNLHDQEEIHSICDTRQEFEKRFPQIEEFQPMPQSVAVFQFPPDMVQLKNTGMMEEIQKYLLGKFITILPVLDKTYSVEKDEEGIKIVDKTFVDVYDVYAMDTTIGQALKIFDVTKSTIGKESGTRLAPVENFVVVYPFFQLPEGDFGFSTLLLHAMCSLFKEYCVLNPFKEIVI